MASSAVRFHGRDMLAFAGLSLGLMTGFRLAILFLVGESAELHAHRAELWPLLVLGLRFDLRIVGMALLVFYWFPAVLVGWWIGADRFRTCLRIGLHSLLALLVLLGCIDLGYHVFFGGPMDVLIFGLLEDDTLAVMGTLVSDWRLVAIEAVFVVLTLGAGWLFHRLGRRSTGRHPGRSWPAYAGVQLVILLGLAVLARGSLDTFPLRAANASVGNSAFVNSLVMNSAFNLHYAYDDHKLAGIHRTSADVLHEAKVGSVAELSRLAGYGDAGGGLRRTAPHAHAQPHVVFVQKEGWSTEIVLGHSEKNDVLGEFAHHINRGHLFRNFYSNAYGTNPTIEALLLNSPVTPLSQSPARKVGFAMSNVLPFKRAGYRTVFISGGDSAWRNHERFWTLQGFDRYVGRATIEKAYNVDASDNPWGVYEQYVFAAVKDAIQEAEAAGVPLFAFVLTTNNHSPVRLPMDYRAPPQDPSVYGLSADDAEKRQMLQGFHYQTDQFGKFLTWINGSGLRDKVVVTATGDHILKGFTNHTATERSYLRYAVPAYFLVPPALDRLRSLPAQVAGSHEDLFPTLFEIALSDQPYFAYGTPIMEKHPERSYGWIETRDFIFPDGASSIESDRLLPWADPQQRVLLSAQGRPLAAWQKDVMARERYRKLLKEWYLLNDFEQQTGAVQTRLAQHQP